MTDDDFRYKFDKEQKLMRIDRWSDEMMRLGYNFAKQARLLKVADKNYIFRLLKKPGDILIDVDSFEVWRKSSIGQ